MRSRYIALIAVILAFVVGAGDCKASEPPLLWGEPVKLEGMSAERVSAVWYKDELHIVHGGKDGDAIWHAWWNGREWSINRVSNLPGGGGGVPTLAVYRNTLHMVYKGDNNTLWHATSQGREWKSQGRLTGQKSYYSPSMAAYPFDPYTGASSERLWLFHGGGSKDTRRKVWETFFDGSAWSDDRETIILSENTVGLCMHDDKLYQSTVYATGVNIMYFVRCVGWHPMETIPHGAKSTTPVCLVSDGDDLYCFYRFSRSGPGKEEPLYASRYKNGTWENPFPLKGFMASDGPAVVAEPGKKGRFHLLFTRNKDIYYTSTQPLKPLKPLLPQPR